MDVLIAGGRDFTDYALLSSTLSALHAGSPISLVIHDSLRGAGALAGVWASRQGIAARSYPATWQRQGRAAGSRRRQQMLDENPGLALVVAFAGGRGTANLVSRAMQSRIEVRMVPEV